MRNTINPGQMKYHAPAAAKAVMPERITATSAAAFYLKLHLQNETPGRSRSLIFNKTVYYETRGRSHSLIF